MIAICTGGDVGAPVPNFRRKGHGKARPDEFLLFVSTSCFPSMLCGMCILKGQVIFNGPARNREITITHATFYRAEDMAATTTDLLASLCSRIS